MTEEYDFDKAYNRMQLLRATQQFAIVLGSVLALSGFGTSVYVSANGMTANEYFGGWTVSEIEYALAIVCFGAYFFAKLGRGKLLAKDDDFDEIGEINGREAIEVDNPFVDPNIRK